MALIIPRGTKTSQPVGLVRPDSDLVRETGTRWLTIANGGGTLVDLVNGLDIANPGGVGVSAGGRTLTFNGAQQANRSIPFQLVTTSTSSVLIAARVRATASQAGMPGAAFGIYNSGGQAGIGVGFDTSNNVGAAWLSTIGAGITATTPGSQNVWYTVFVQLLGASGNLGFGYAWVNGKPAASNQGLSLSGASQPINEIAIGAQHRSSGFLRQFKGDIEWAALIDRNGVLMTDDDAAALYASGYPYSLFSDKKRIYFSADAGPAPIVIPATGTASLAAVSLIASQSIASGVGAASSALDSVGLTAANATASGGTSIPATGSGALVGISLASTQGLANGSALASAALENVSLTPATGSASAGTSIPGNASASLASASITPASAQATAAATAAGPIVGMNLTPAQAQAASEAWASAQMVAIGLTAATGTANNLPNDFEPADQWRTLTIERSTRIMVVRRDDRTLIVQRQNRVAKA